MTVLISANSHRIWTMGDTLRAAQDEADAIGGYRQEWTAISDREFDGGRGNRYIAVAVPAGDWEADDAVRALAEGEVLGLWRAEDVLEHAA
ncbi:MAG: hypothetical protein AB7O76_06885 [Rhizobiaceae bacterium]